MGAAGGLEVRTGVRAAELAVRAAARPRRARAAPLSGRHRRRRPRRPDARLRPRAARHRGRRPRRGRHRRRARRVVARHLLRAEEPRDLRPARHLRADPRQGHHLVGRPHVLGRRRDLLVQPEGRELLRAAAVHQPAAVLPRVVPGRAHPRARRRARSAGRARSSRVEHGSDGAVVEVETPAGAYALEADWFIDATGANSRIRDELGLEAHASRHTDRWCISDVRFKKPLRGRALDLDRRAVQRGPRASGST